MSKQIVLTDEQRDNFNKFLDLCDRYKNSWFWGNNGNARLRRYKEKKDFLEYETEVNGVVYSVHFSVQLSCRNVYVTKIVKRGGEVTTARVIRTLVEKDIGGVAWKRKVGQKKTQKQHQKLYLYEI